MRKQYILSSLVLPLLMFASCSDTDGKKDGGRTGELTLSGFVQDYGAGKTRVLGNNFFEEGFQIDVSISKSGWNSPQSYEYVYHSTGIFAGNPGFFFSLDDQYITELTAVWPTESIRESGIVTDQRLEADFKLADWMTATATVDGVVPTDAPVPLNFVRENCMLEFELAGQNSEGLDIQWLIIELQSGSQSEAFWAYCGDPSGHAKLILEEGTELYSEDKYLIGRMSVNNVDEYTIIFPSVDLVLEAGKRYLVTLTPQGYDINAYVFIAGWTQDEEQGIGIPFSPPVPNDDGTFTIYEPQQLIAMSFLIRHYYHPQTWDWYSRTFIIDDSFVMTEEAAALYIPVPAADFTGQVLHNGAPVTSVEYGDGEVLELFE